MVNRLEDLAPLMLDQLPGCPTAIMLDAARRMARDFCRRTRAWRWETTFAAVEDQTDYAIQPPYSADIIQATSIKLRSASQATEGLDGTELDKDSYKLETIGPGSINLHLEWEPGETEANAIQVELALAPQVGLVEFEDGTFLARWAEGIAAGAVMRLAGQPAARWGNPAVFAQARRDYYNAVSDAMAETGRLYRPGAKGLEG